MTNSNNSTDGAEGANSSGRPIFGPRTTTFERAWRRLEDLAAGERGAYSPRGAARAYLLAERASRDAQNDEAVDHLGEQSTSRLERVAATCSRDLGDVAAKLAALIIENGQEDPVSGGGIPAAIHTGLCACLADLILLTDGPLPDASAVLNMKAPDFELRDATEAEAAEERAQAQVPKAPSGETPSDPAGTRIDIEDARGSVEEILSGTRGLRELLGRPWRAESVDGLRGAALWAVGNLESDAENALSRIEEAARALGVPESAA